MTTLAIIGIVLGSLGVICTPFGLIPYFFEFGPPNPVVDAIKENNLAFIWTIGSNILGILMAVVLLAGSIGSLKLSPWARSAMLAYAALSLLMMAVGTVIHLTTLKPIMDEAYSQMPGAGEMGKVITIFTFAIMGLFLVFLACILYFYNTAKVKEAFAHPPAAVI